MSLIYNKIKKSLFIVPLLLLITMKTTNKNQSVQSDGSDGEKMSERYEMCKCGHMGGNSPNKNTHVDRFQIGHGRCLACECSQFTWVRFCDSEGKKKSFGWGLN